MAKKKPLTVSEMAKLGGHARKAKLSKEQFQVLRLKGTEAPGSSKFNKAFQNGVYHCAGCDSELYKSDTKFDSGCGWPAFFEGVKGAVKEIPDPDGRRTEILCSKCGCHLGHVFKGEGYKTPTDARHCVNGISLKFTKA